MIDDLDFGYADGSVGWIDIAPGYAVDSVKAIGVVVGAMIALAALVAWIVRHK